MPIDLTMPLQFHGILRTIGWMDVLDILVVAAILYKVYEMLADTRAISPSCAAASSIWDKDDSGAATAC